jgi:hypothetical protein
MQQEIAALRQAVTGKTRKNTVLMPQRYMDEKETIMLDGSGCKGKAKVKPANYVGNEHLSIDVATANAADPSQLEKASALDSTTQHSRKSQSSINKVHSGPPRSPNSRTTDRGKIINVQRQVATNIDAVASDGTFKGLTDEPIINFADSDSQQQQPKLLDASLEDCSAKCQPETPSQSRSPVLRRSYNDIIVVSIEDSVKMCNLLPNAHPAAASRSSSICSPKRSPLRTDFDAAPEYDTSRSPRRSGGIGRATKWELTPKRQSKPTPLPGLHWELPAPGCEL